MRKTSLIFTLLLLAGTLCGCAVRSISNSGYPGDYRTKNPYYSGELSEMAVLGSADGGAVSEADIKRALENRQDVKLKRGASIVVIQSGAISPDEAMLDELRKSFLPVPFSGIPSKEDPNSYSKRLRLTAAQGGYTHILCYWGTIETATEDKATKAISWVPVAGAFIPDEAQQMRIRLRAALVDVLSGKWVMITPDPNDDSALSSSQNRVKADQKQVIELKKKAYSTLVSELVRYFSV